MVVRLDGLYVNTFEEQMRLAAFMAVWNVVTVGAQPLTLTFEDGRWEAGPP
ncbi:hypothetical protein [Deinococcus hopiensis]|uniref:hypothetical protein n=1 Tax=Deinococcus hopiensis TaxID=309885 RepID=UPI001481FAC9|nr:hypothetical protein [Deinococcus hopiensis]